MQPSFPFQYFLSNYPIACCNHRNYFHHVQQTKYSILEFILRIHILLYCAIPPFPQLRKTSKKNKNSSSKSNYKIYTEKTMQKNGKKKHKQLQFLNNLPNCFF